MVLTVRVKIATQLIKLELRSRWAFCGGQCERPMDGPFPNCHFSSVPVVLEGHQPLRQSADGLSALVVYSTCRVLTWLSETRGYSVFPITTALKHFEQRKVIVRQWCRKYADEANQVKNHYPIKTRKSNRPIVSSVWKLEEEETKQSRG